MTDTLSVDAQQELAIRLRKELGECLYTDLQAACIRGVVFVVTPEVQLLDVALAVAIDDSARVECWLQEKQLQRPGPAQLISWKREPTTRFRSIIVQPYVLIQELSDIGT